MLTIILKYVIFRDMKKEAIKRLDKDTEEYGYVAPVKNQDNEYIYRIVINKKELITPSRYIMEKIIKRYERNREVELKARVSTFARVQYMTPAEYPNIRILTKFRWDTPT